MNNETSKEKTFFSQEYNNFNLLKSLKILKVEDIAKPPLCDNKIIHLLIA